MYVYFDREKIRTCRHQVLHWDIWALSRKCSQLLWLLKSYRHWETPSSPRCGDLCSVKWRLDLIQPKITGKPKPETWHSQLTLTKATLSLCKYDGKNHHAKSWCYHAVNLEVEIKPPQALYSSKVLGCNSIKFRSNLKHNLRWFYGPKTVP